MTFIDRIDEWAKYFKLNRTIRKKYEAVLQSIWKKENDRYFN